MDKQIKYTILSTGTLCKIIPPNDTIDSGCIHSIESMLRIMTKLSEINKALGFEAVFEIRN